MKALFQFTTLWAVILVTSNVASAQPKPQFKFPESNPFKDMLPANFCDVINHPQAYDGKLIRLRVIWWQTIEGATLFPYDSRCLDAMRPVFDCPADVTCKLLLDRIYRSLGSRHFDVTAGMVLKGRLRYHRFVTRTEFRFGRGHYDFEVVDFEESLSLPDKPNDKGWPPDFLLRPNKIVGRERRRGVLQAIGPATRS
jgi:hypothetical protein